MSLNFSYADVSEEGRKLIFAEKPEGGFNNFCQQLSFTLMQLGMSGITDKNIDEFMFREIVFKKVYGEDMKSCIEEKKLRAMIGFEVNVCTITRAQFMKDIVRRLEEQAREELISRAGGWEKYMAARRKMS